MMVARRQIGARRYEGLADGWVVERLDEWGAAQRGGWVHGGGYGQSCLTLPEIRSTRPHGFVPELPGHGEATDAAVRKLPRELQSVAGLVYRDRLTGKEVARELGVSEAQVTRLKQMLVQGVKYCLENQNVTTHLVKTLLKS